MANIVVNGDTSGSVTLSAPAVSGSTTITLPTTSGTMLTTAGGAALGTPSSGNLTNCTSLPLSTGVTGTLAEANGGTGTTTGYYGFKNRIINGAMVIDQRNSGASVTQTVATTYVTDRFAIYGSVTSKFTVQQNAGSVTTQAGFPNYLGVTSSSAYSVVAGDFFTILQSIEGFNVADLAFGTSSAATVTVSFWVRSSLTGTFGGSLRNYAGTRSYPFTYTISSANTWEQKSITIAGDTGGTWVGASSSGSMILTFSLGAGSTYSGTAGAWASANYTSATGATSVVGTNGATFYITGVQLEKGSTATSFDYRPYGTELALCQRYYWRSSGTSGYPYIYGNGFTATAYVSATVAFPVQMRTAPTINKYGTWSASGCGQPTPLGVDQNGFTLYVSATGATNVACGPTGSTTYLDTSGAEL